MMNNKILDITDKIKACKEFENVSRLYESNKKDMELLRKSLTTNPDLMSFVQTNTELYIKIFTIICANAFEKIVPVILPLILSGEINKIEKIETISDYKEIYYMSSFLKKNSFKTRFHTLFDWDVDGNVNKLLGMFGKGFKKRLRKEIDEKEDMCDGEKAFILIGTLRNKLAHEGIYEEKLYHDSLKKIYEKYQSALNFISFLFNRINQVLHSERQ